MVCNPIATPDDCFLAEEIAKADPEVKVLLAERYGHTDMELLVCDPWSIHACPLEGRLIQCFMYLKTRWAAGGSAGGLPGLLPRGWKPGLCVWVGGA